MKKTGANVISLLKPRRRSEQTGLTQKSFTARWLGFLLMTSVGAAWALSPGLPDEPSARVGDVSRLDAVVFEGEPQVVAQLMGAVVGSDSTPCDELRSMAAFGESHKRVVLAAIDIPETSSVSKAELRASAESLEEVYLLNGRYPAIPSDKANKKGLSYKTSGDRFQLGASTSNYDSDKGLVTHEGEAVGLGFQVVGFLQGVTEGWGPWKKERQIFTSRGSAEDLTHQWLEQAPVTPTWSARMYFPISVATTGYAFRRGDGTSAYRSGEVLYDGVTGTFQVKLYRKGEAESTSLAPSRLEQELSLDPGRAEFVGDACLLEDLGLFPGREENDQVVHLSNPVRLTASVTGALDGLALMNFGKHKKTLIPGQYAEVSGSNEEKASVVGALGLQDGMGQVHDLRVRAGRATDFDWIVGQLCPLEEKETANSVQVHESQAFENTFDRKNESSVIAGK